MLRLAAAAGAGATLGGCSGSDEPALRLFIWSDYIDPTLIEQFESEAGVPVVHDNYSADSELETKLLSGGGAYDVVVPSDRSMPALVAKGLLAEVDHALLPNLGHLDPTFTDAPFDRGNRHSVPYFWGTVAVGVRTDRVPNPPSSFAALFDEHYADRITMLDDAEHAVAMALQHLGRPANSVKLSDLDEAQKLLIAQRPLVQAYTSDAYKEKLVAGDAWVSLGWSGDLRQAADLDENVRVIVPEKGTTIWLDSLAIPRAAPNAQLAHRFINFLLDPEVAARNAEYVHYATPNLAALKRLPADERNDASVYPPKATLDRCEWLKDRGAEIAKVERVWREVRQ
jgi:spermidine/putrescine transport system substrate-binding protein